MLQFSNPIVAGTTLVRPAVQSPNYAHGSAGWTVNQDGSAEFNNVTVRGTIVAGQFIGTGEGQEIVIYAGVPAANNVVASVCSANATDASGNALIAGATSYHEFASNNFQASSVGGGFVTFYKSATGMNSWLNVGSLEGSTLTTGSGTANILWSPGGLIIGTLGIDANGVVQTPLAVNAAITATAGTAAAPTLITTDTGHVATNANSWTGTLTYELLSDGLIAWDGIVVPPAGVANPSSICAAVPAVYRPTTDKNLTAVADTNASHVGAALLCKMVAATGQVQVYAATATQAVHISGSYPANF